jgi:antirestriction protein ArdC
MARTPNQPSGGENGKRAGLYQDVTDRIIAQLEQGRVPWVQPWSAAKVGVGLPENAATGRRYSGVNILILWAAVIEKGFPSQDWLTFRQALDLGGSVRKGEHGTTVFYADRFVPKAEIERATREGNEPEAIPFLKRFTVFNVAQCDGVERLPGKPDRLPERAIIPSAEALIAATRADIRIGGDRAFYSPGGDYIQVPPQPAFFEQINFYRTCFHELSHWSGAAHRLNRDMSGRFGSPSYGREELVAEMGSAFICASLNIMPTVRHADYLGAWLDILREDNRAIFRAASQASKAADYILAFREEGSEIALPVEASA